jgi:hypothetical protein
MNFTKMPMLMLAALSLATACATSVTGTRSFGDVPDWYLNPGKGAGKGEICGVGAYRAADLDYTRAQAVTNARADLVATLRAKVDQAVKNTLSEVVKIAPDADLPQADRVSEAFRQSLASDTLVGAAVKEAYVAKDGNVFVRVAISRDSIERSLRQTLSAAVTTGMRAHADLVEERFRDQIDRLPWNDR